MAHTADLTPAELASIRALLDVAFVGTWDEHDWDHTLGGLHVLMSHQGEVVAHAAVVARRMLHGGASIRTGYVEAVAVAPWQRGRGRAAAVMGEVERVIRAAYQLGALSAGAGVEDMYAARGWVAWQGPTYVMTPTGRMRTPAEDASTHVLPVEGGAAIRLTGTLTCDWRDGDVW